MRKARENRELTLAVSLALTAGLFAAPQTACGAPVLDPNSTRNANNVVVKQSGAVTDIIGRKAHNVIDWKDFSIGAGETVRFDQGAKEKDYLNLVTGGEPSTINGALKGGKDVYLVNPNGVVFGKGASVDVGNLYVSTTKANLDVTAYLASGASPLVNTASQAAGDVTNLGKIAANRVEVEGGTIKFLSTGDVRDAKGAKGAINQNVSLTTSTGTIQIGHDDGDTTQYTTWQAAATPTAAPSAVVPEEYQTVKTIADLQSLKTGDKTVKYWLYNDIDAAGQAYTPVGSDGSAAFQGTFEGNFFSVSNLQVSGVQYGGLFGRTDGATIRDVGVKNGSISADRKTGSAGGIVGWAADTTLKNVFNSKTAVSASIAGGIGGIVGKTSGTVTIDTAYNTGAYGTHGGGILGLLDSGSATIQNAYNTDQEDGSVLVFTSNPGTTLTIDNAYTVGKELVTTYAKGSIKSTHTVVNASETSASKYGDLTGLSSSGTEDTVWRIYEGHTMPLLRAFLRGNANGGTVTVNYDYSMGKDPDGSSVAGSNGGADLTKTYNANDLVLRNVTYTGSKGGTIDTSKIQTDSAGLHDANVYGNANGVDYFYCGQDGYDLVGNHINIEQREVDLTNSIDKSSVMRKAYDGTTAVDAKAVASLFAAGKSDGKGLILGDNTASFNTSNLKGTFDTATVGQGKTVTLSGGVTLENAAGHNNYKISQGSTTFDGQTLQGIITPRVLTVTSKESYTKVYNKEADTKTTPAALDFQLSNNIVKGETVELSLTNPSGTYGDGTGTAFTENANAGSRTVKLSGLSLSGANAANYILEDSEKNILFSSKYDADARDVGGINLSSGGALFTTGTITKRNILNTGFQWYKDGVAQNATREYHNSADYTAPVGYEVRSNSTTVGSNTETGMIDGDALTFQVNSAKFVKSEDGTDATETKNAGEAKGVQYTVTVTGDAAKNYTLGGQDIVAGTNIVYGKGSITPRTINVIANNDKIATKIYDGDAIVKDATDTRKGTDSNPFTLNDGYLKYADNDANHHLLDDGSKITYTGVYTSTNGEAAKDVNYDTVNNVVQNKNVTYVAQVTNRDGTKSSNYSFVEVTDPAQAQTEQTFTGTGIITQKEIAKMTFDDVSKEYDGTATVTGTEGTTDVIRVTGVEDADGNNALIASESLDHVLSADKIKQNVHGTYGKRTNGTFEANEHVANGGAAKSKDVQYTGVRSILGDNHNYRLADGISDTMYGKGAITPLSITDRKTLYLEKKQNFTKVYDGTTSVASNRTDAGAYIGALTYRKTEGANPVTLDYSIESADYATKNSGNGATQNVSYYLNVGGKGEYTGDYKLSNALLSTESEHKGQFLWSTADNTRTIGLNGATKAMTGVISKRNVNASLGQGNVRKVYDGSRVVKVNESPIRATQAVTMEDQNDANQTGWLRSDAKNYTVNAQYDTKNAGEGKTVTYTVTLSGESADNYNLRDANGNALQTANTLTGTGAIDKAPLTITFDKASKVYDGTTDVVGVIDGTTKGDKAGTIKANYTGIQTDAEKNTRDDVRLTGDDAASNYAGYQAAFNDPNVRDARYVTYRVALTGDDAKNYFIANTPGEGVGNLQNVLDANGTRYQTIRGAGQIYTKQITDADVVVDFTPTISKVYDASRNVSYNHINDSRYFDDEKGSAENADYVRSITIDGHTLTADDYDINSAQYNSAGVDANSATYKFGLNKDSKLISNFDLSHLSGNLFDQSSYVLTKTDTRGVSITPKKVTAAINDPTVMEKVYNGNTNLVTNSQNDIDGTPIVDLQNKVALTGLVNDNGDNASLDIAQLNGRYDTKDVAYQDNDPTKEIANKNVLFDVHLKGNGADNYTLIDATNADNQAASKNNGSIVLTGTGLGKITPRELGFYVDPITKTYDGTADLTDANKTAYTPTFTNLIDGENLTPDKNSITGQYGEVTNDVFTADGNVTSPKDAVGNYVNQDGNEGYKAMEYSGLKNALTNASGTSDTVKASNYTIGNSKRFAATDEKGKITRLSINKTDIQEGWKSPVTKEYDGTENIANPENFYGLYIASAKGIDLPNRIVFSYNLDPHQKSGYNSQNVSEADTVTLHIRGLKNSDRLSNNFTMSGDFDFKDYTRNVSLKNGDLLDAQGRKVDAGGTAAVVAITPRTVYAKVADGNLKKTYDGLSDAEKAADQQSFITYTHKNANGEDVEGLVHTATANDTDASTGVYIAADGNATANATANTVRGANRVKYTLGINTADQSNYTVYDATNPTMELSTTASGGTLNGGGSISQKTLTLVDKDGLNKVYDGTAALTSDALKHLKLDGLVTVNGVTENLTLDVDPIKGAFLSTSGEQAQDVNWNEQTNSADDKDVSITGGVQDALANATSTNGALSGNYTIADTAYFVEAAMKGKIKPLALTMQNIQQTWKPAVKEYDGSSAVDHPQDQLKLTLNPIVSNGNNLNVDGITVDYALKTAANDTGANYVDSMGNSVKDAGKNLTVRYDMNGLTGVKNADGTENHNFSLENISGPTSMTNNSAGHKITPRVLTVKTVDGANWNKIYNGNAEVENASKKFIFVHKTANGTEENAIVSGDTANVAVTDAYYTDASGAHDKNAANGKGIVYDAEIKGDDNKGNYTFVSAEPGEAVHNRSDADAGVTGDIAKRKVYAGFSSGTPTDITKTYDGGAILTDANGNLSNWQSHVEMNASSEDPQHTGFVNGDDVSLIRNGVSVSFDDPNVARDANGRVTTKQVAFDNINLTGDDAKNYEVDTSGLSGATGTIQPKAIHVSIKTTPNKEYDGTRGLNTNYHDANGNVINQASEDNIQVDTSGELVGNDTLNVSLQSGKAPSYDNAHSNQTNGGKGIGVTYALNWDNGNYVLAHTPSGSSDTQSMTTDGMSGALRTESGIITPRTLTIDSIAPLTKVYDGTRAVEDTVTSQTRDEDGVYHDGDERNHSTAQIGLGRIVNDDTIGFTASGQYDNPYAASSESGDTQAHAVTYRLSVTNTDYALASDTVTGKGTILRRGLTVQAVPAEIYAGQDMPAFTGRVTGWMPGESDGSADFAFQAYSHTVGTDGREETVPLTTAQMPGSYAVYGMYNGRAAGNYGQSYRFEQAPANDTAFTINYIPDKPYRETINPSHHPVNGGGISVPRSQNTGMDFVKPAQANIAYPAKGGPAAVNLVNSSDTVTPSAYRAYTQQRGTTIGTMEILNADVVNLDSSRRVDLGDSTAVMQQAAGSRVGRIEIKSADNGATLTITNDFPEAFEAEHQVSEKKAQAAVEHASA